MRSDDRNPIARQLPVDEVKRLANLIPDPTITTTGVFLDATATPPSGAVYSLVDQPDSYLALAAWVSIPTLATGGRSWMVGHVSQDGATLYVAVADDDGWQLVNGQVSHASGGLVLTTGLTPHFGVFADDDLPSMRLWVLV